MLQIKILILIVVSIASGLAGYRLADGKYKSLISEIQAENARALAIAKERAEVIIEKYIVQKEIIYKKAEPIIKEIVREVEKPIYSECVVPDSGRVLLDNQVREINSALDADFSVPEDTGGSEPTDNGEAINVFE